ncbi:putative late blight resistance protein homolog R1A-4 [Coffea arabica]|uniref:Late blight resistance protein homolog R1A-4 n=1 Tax=Coffea arabica TaxID=13443 RepID=A0A6P6V5K4_COFAR|nr:putative late blight resistance protein homolog R1A-4 [Coffea arabica]XP_027097961.1 putative late blight resistance protein homolog R1A-4 [Coffea arabica]
MGQTASSSSAYGSDRYVSACLEVFARLQNLEEQFKNKKFNLAFLLEQPNGDMFSSVKDQMKTFADEYHFLTMFIKCFCKFSYEGRKEMESQFAKVAAEYQEIGNEIVSVRGFVKVSKLADVFPNLLEKIQVLKPEIAEICDYLWRHSVEPESSSDSYDLPFNELLYSLQILLTKADLIDPPKGQIKSLSNKLSNLVDFLKNWKLDDFELKYLLICARVTSFQGLNLCCLCWLKKTDPNVTGEIGIAFSNLKQKIDPANPEFLKMMINILDYKLDKVNVRTFIYHLIQLNFDVYLLPEKLRFLILAFFKLRMDPVHSPFFKLRKDPVYSPLVLPDIAAVLGEIESLVESRSKGSGTDFLAFKIAARICLLREDIFFIQQLLTSRSEFHEIDSSARSYFLNDTRRRVEDIHQTLGLLRKGLEGLPEGDMENGKETVEFIEEEAKELESLKTSLEARKISPVAAGKVILKLLVRSLVFRADAYLMDLMSSNANLILPAKDQIGTLKSLIASIRNVPNKLIFSNIAGKVTEDESLIMIHIQEVAREVIHFYHSFHAANVTEDLEKELSTWLSGLIKKTMGAVNGIDIPLPKMIFPETNGLGFINLFLRKLTELLRNRCDSLVSVERQIEEIQENLGFLRSFLGMQDIRDQEWNDIGRRTVDAAYRAEFVIDSIVVGNGAELKHFIRLHLVSEDIRLVKMQVEEKAIGVGVQNAIEGITREIPQTSTIGADEDVLVLKDQQQVIVNRLTRGSSQRDIVSIAGMAGIGKTTLANKVYNDPEIVSYFHVRACCCVSQVYTKRDLLLEILGHIIELTDNILVKPVEDLELLLSQKLRRNRYLVFMDDIWGIEAWNQLQNSFPDDRNGSRVLITSRLQVVVSKVTDESHLLNLRPLSDDESWELLRRKTFFKQGCPEALLEIGKEIARKCKGLPLSVVVAAGFLKAKNMTPKFWKEISDSINSLKDNDPQKRCMDILELSYNHLPDYLKSCFLYCGAFEGDKEIPVWKLIWQWMAEGFVQESDLKSLEDLADDYLKDLIGRSLLMVARRRSNGRVKACRIHDTVRTLCVLKAKKENFLSLITTDDEPYASFDDISDFDDFDRSNSVTYEEYRLSFSVSRKLFLTSNPSGPNVRSLLFFATTDMDPRCLYDVSFIFNNFKLLKVLDLGCVNMGSSFAAGIMLLLLLRYIAVAGYMDSIPSSLAKLQYLETFIVKGWKGKVFLPITFWSMTRLRHVHVDDHAVFTLPNEKVGGSSQLINLVSLSTPSLSFGDTEEIIARLPNLKKLSCIFPKLRNHSTSCYEFPRLGDLTLLESLKILYRGKTLDTGEFHFPVNLKKLSLSNFYLRWDHISTIGALENLEVLKLVSITFEDTTWEMGDDEFSELKFLKLDAVNIVEWNASSDHLPKLQQLVLRKCEKLKGVPVDFVDISTLQMIEVQLCCEAVEKSVVILKEEEKLRFGTEDLKVLISH